jgi:F-box domain.
MSNFLRLPNELCVEIALYLNFEDIYNLSLVCSNFSFLLYETMLAKDIGISINRIRKRYKKNRVIKSYKLSKDTIKEMYEHSFSFLTIVKYISTHRKREIVCFAIKNNLISLFIDFIEKIKGICKHYFFLLYSIKYLRKEMVEYLIKNKFKRVKEYCSHRTFIPRSKHCKSIRKIITYAEKILEDCDDFYGFFEISCVRLEYKILHHSLHYSFHEILNYDEFYGIDALNFYIACLVKKERIKKAKELYKKYRKKINQENILAFDVMSKTCGVVNRYIPKIVKKFI